MGGKLRTEQETVLGSLTLNYSRFVYNFSNSFFHLL